MHHQPQSFAAATVKRRRAIIVLQVVVKQVMLAGHKVQQHQHQQSVDQLMEYSTGNSIEYGYEDVIHEKPRRVCDMCSIYKMGYKHTFY